MNKRNLFLVAGLMAAYAGNALAAEDSSLSIEESIPISSLGPVGTTLEDFYTAALSYSPNLRIAAEKLNVGAARRRIANGRLLPQVTASANINENKRVLSDITSRYPGQRYSVQLNQVLFNWQAFAARGQAYLVEDQIEAEYYHELATTLADVAEKYFAVLQAEDALVSIHTELNAISNQLNQVQSFYDRQLAQITDLYNAQAQLASVQADEVELENELAISREELRSATGMSAGKIFRLPDEIIISPLEESIDYWVQEARVNSPLIRSHEFSRLAAAKNISQQRGAYLPRVSLILQHQNSDIGYENSSVPETDTSYVGLDVSIPLFAGGSSRAAVSEATSQHNIAANQLRQVQLEVAQRTRAAYLQVKSLENRTLAARRLAESTALAARASQRGFELGTVSSVDVLNALRDQFQAERDLLFVRYEHLKLQLKLKREAGTLDIEDLLETDSLLEKPQD